MKGNHYYNGGWLKMLLFYLFIYFFRRELGGVPRECSQ